MRFIPTPPPDELKTCPRCYLQSRQDANACTHCTGLSDITLKNYLMRHKNQTDAGATLGRYFAVAAVVILLLMFYGLLNK